MPSLRSKQTARGLSHRVRQDVAHPKPDAFGFTAHLPDAMFQAEQAHFRAVPATSKREQVWTRLGELAGAMRSAGVSEDKILDILRYHTPTQIEMAFSRMAHLHPDAVAKIILLGKFGYRAGIKKNKQPPDTRLTVKLMEAQRKKEAKCPVVPQAQVQGLLADYLEQLTQ